MKYEIVTLSEKKILGLSIRTHNQEPTMGEKIGNLWKDLYNGTITSIPQPLSSTAYGLYTNYASDVTGEYDVVVGLEVSPFVEAPALLVSATIPHGTYAKFSFVGNAAQGVGRLWQEIWGTELNRKYSTDFEEYLPSDDIENAQMNIYIALKD